MRRAIGVNAQGRGDRYQPEGEAEGLEENPERGAVAASGGVRVRDIGWFAAWKNCNRRSWGAQPRKRLDSDRVLPRGVIGIGQGW